MLDIADLRAGFVERFGIPAQAEGGSRMAGRLFGLSAFEGHAMTAPEMARASRIGRSSVVEAARCLEPHGMVRRLGREWQRQEGPEPTPFLRPAPQRPVRARRAAMCRDFGEIVAALPGEAGETRGRFETHARLRRRIVAARCRRFHSDRADPRGAAGDRS